MGDKIKVSGYKFKEAIKDHELVRDAATHCFDGSFYKFKDEQKEDPQTVLNQINKAELSIVKLQTAQSMYNLIVKLSVQGEEMLLCEAIKRVGPAERTERLWKQHIRTLNYGQKMSRNLDEKIEEAVLTMSIKDVTVQCAKASKLCNALKTAIAAANATEVEVEGLDPALFA
jgi:hypothetical protein